MDKSVSPKKRAALYIRVSSDEQAIHGLSLDSQRKSLIEYANAHSYHIAGLYSDEGVTARKKFRVRPAFVRMLEDVKAGLIDVILFIKLDRWFRNVSDYYEVQRVLDRHNVEWVATEEKYDTTTANGRLNLNIRLAIAQDESDRTSERIKFVFRDKIARGEVVSGNAPLGYRIEGKKLVPEPEEAKLIRGLFNFYLDCRSVRQTRKYVLEHYDKALSVSGIRLILTNERYIGRSHGRDGFCVPIIAPEAFSRTQKLITQRGQRNASLGRVYLFSGLVFCSECGGAMSGHTIRAEYTYYRCNKYARSRECPHRRQENEQNLESWLLENLNSRLNGYTPCVTVLPQCRKPNPDSEKQLRSRMAKLKDLYLDDLIDRDEYAHDYEVLRKKLESPPDAAPPSIPAGSPYNRSFAEAYMSLDRTHRKAFWSYLIDKIEISMWEDVRVIPSVSLANHKQPVC